jgi:hypothetical protein
MSTLSGDAPIVRTQASVMAATSARFCSALRPSNISIRIVGIGLPLLQGV